MSNTKLEVILTFSGLVR